MELTLKEAKELIRIYKNKIARQDQTILYQKNELDSLKQKLELKKEDVQQIMNVLLIWE